MPDINHSDQAKKIYFDTIEYLRSVAEKVTAGSPFELEPGVHIINKIVDEPGLLQDLFPLSMKALQEENYIIPHQANDMLYVLKIGMGLQYSRTQLIEVGLAALMHDIGMYKLPQPLVDKSEKPLPTEMGILRSHVEHGRDLLSPFKEKYPFLPEVVYQHHEREDGSGYPRGLRGKEINEYAKILCLMDCYEAMTHNRPDRKALNQTFSAKELMVEMKNTGFEPRIIKAFLEEITLYPVGAYVRLNNKCICEVVATSRSNPLRPDILIRFDHKGNRVKGKQIIKLKENPLFYIEECISAECMPEDVLSLA
jgi:HD-GYP domain-containing protein (c-di-GMP phosphodiesterase class II)